MYKCPTCQGNSLTSVWTPPTMRVLLLATPQLQVLGTLAGEEVVIDGTSVVVVVVGVVGAEYYVTKLKTNIILLECTFQFFPSKKKTRPSTKIVSVESNSH